MADFCFIIKSDILILVVAHFYSEPLLMMQGHHTNPVTSTVIQNSNQMKFNKQQHSSSYLPATSWSFKTRSCCANKWNDAVTIYN